MKPLDVSRNAIELGDFPKVDNCIEWSSSLEESSSLFDNFIPAAMCIAIREQIIDDHAADGEEEHQQRPQNLMQHRTVGWQDFDCATCINTCCQKPLVMDKIARGTGEGRSTY